MTNYLHDEEAHYAPIKGSPEEEAEWSERAEDAIRERLYECRDLGYSFDESVQHALFGFDHLFTQRDVETLAEELEWET